MIQWNKLKPGVYESVDKRFYIAKVGERAWNLYDRETPDKSGGMYMEQTLAACKKRAKSLKGERKHTYRITVSTTVDVDEYDREDAIKAAIKKASLNDACCEVEELADQTIDWRAIANRVASGDPH